MGSLSLMIPPGLRELARKTRRAARRATSGTVQRLKRPNLYRLDTQERVGVVFTAPSDMRVD